MFIVLEVLLLTLKIIAALAVDFYHLFVPYPKKDVSGKVVLITGAGHGLGRSFALHFARLGSTLVLWDVNTEGNEETAKQVRELGTEAYTFTVDVRKKDVVYETAKSVQDKVGTVDILFNNAGVISGEEICNLTDSQIVRTFEVNAISHFWILKAFLPDMIKRNEGHIVTIASQAGKFGTPRMSDYCASKYAAVGLGESLHSELRVLGRAGVKTTLVCPFFIDTGMFTNLSFKTDSILKQDDAVSTIVDGVLRNKREIVIPSKHNIRIMFKAFAPFSVYDLIEDFTAINVGSQSGKYD
ncbi:17-beta-hydroxysteroid dehydrogenase 13-like [Antedon mediterranea]|uniref:17-beta-hydroxysteroid dehydrogenase 13-like n=1 Tax=Antedon mediterranea TaxID=105859 RepID=UPI003AF4B3ED